jgi:hypothetical protein
MRGASEGEGASERMLAVKSAARSGMLEGGSVGDEQSHRAVSDPQVQLMRSLDGVETDADQLAGELFRREGVRGLEPPPRCRKRERRPAAAKCFRAHRVEIVTGRLQNNGETISGQSAGLRPAHPFFEVDFRPSIVRKRR